MRRPLRLQTRDRALSEKSNGEERVLTSRESLQSIAVELHRGNEMAAASLVLQQRQVDLIANLMDFVRLQQTNASTGNAQMMEAISGFVGPLSEMLGSQAARRPEIRTAAGRSAPSSVTHEGDGIRVSKAPEPTGAE